MTWHARMSEASRSSWTGSSHVGYLLGTLYACFSVIMLEAASTVLTCQTLAGSMVYCSNITFRYTPNGCG